MLNHLVHDFAVSPVSGIGWAFAGCESIVISFGATATSGLAHPGFLSTVRVHNGEAIFRTINNLLHPVVSDRDRDVVVGPTAQIIFGAQELNDIWMVTTHDAHVGATAEGTLLDGFGTGAECINKRKRAGCASAGAGDDVTIRAQARKTETGTAAGLLNQGDVLQSVEDLLNGVFNRQHETCREHAHGTASVHQRGRVRHEGAGGHQLIKALGPLIADGFAELGIFRTGNCGCDPPKKTFWSFVDFASDFIFGEVAIFEHSPGVFG